MSIIEILQRSLSGYIFLIPGLLLYFWYLRKRGKEQTPFRTVATFVFCYYIIGILTMIGIGAIDSFSPIIVLIPFKDMITGPVDTILNVILFLPLGFFLPLLYQKFDSIRKVTLTGFLFSLSIEFLQMFNMGSTDINDLITNTIGTFLGCYIYNLFSKLLSQEQRKKVQANVANDYKELLFFIIYSLIIMLTVQPMVIGSLFHLG